VLNTAHALVIATAHAYYADIQRVAGGLKKKIFALPGTIDFLLGGVDLL